MTMTTEVQGALFGADEVPGTTPLVPEEPGWNYAHHLFQRSGNPMWKLGETKDSPRRRARQISCTAVAWWHGSQRSERRMHKLWKYHRVSPAAEFFWQDGDELDCFVLKHIKAMPAALRQMQIEVFAQIEVRYHQEYGGKLSNQLLMDLLTALSAQRRTETGDALFETLKGIFYAQLGAKKIA